MESGTAGISQDLLSSYVDEQLDGLAGAARRERLAEIRVELARDVDAGQLDERDASTVRSFLAGIDDRYPTADEPPAPPRPVNNARAVRRGVLAIMPRLMLIMMMLLGAARTGGARHAVFAGMAIVLIMIGRAAYLSVRTGSA